MGAEEQEALHFQTCRDLAGYQRSVGTYRRNGQVVLNLGPSWFSPSIFNEPEVCDGNDVTRLVIPDDLFANLTEVEARTWRKILNGFSPAEIAEQEGVSGAAIYERIRGKNGQGGMVKKNRYVARWWDMQKRRRRKCVK